MLSEAAQPPLIANALGDRVPPVQAPFQCCHPEAGAARRGISHSCRRLRSVICVTFALSERSLAVFAGSGWHSGRLLMSDPLHRLIGQLVERCHTHLEMLFFGVFDLVVANPVQALHEHHHGRHSGTRDFRGVMQRS